MTAYCRDEGYRRRWSMLKLWCLGCSKTLLTMLSYSSCHRSLGSNPNPNLNPNPISHPSATAPPGPRMSLRESSAHW